MYSIVSVHQWYYGNLYKTKNILWELKIASICVGNFRAKGVFGHAGIVLARISRYIKASIGFEFYHYPLLSSG